MDENLKFKMTLLLGVVLGLGIINLLLLIVGIILDD